MHVACPLLEAMERSSKERLMQRTTKYVALDLHQATTVAAARKESGPAIARIIFPMKEAAVGRGKRQRGNKRDLAVIDDEDAVHGRSTRR